MWTWEAGIILLAMRILRFRASWLAAAALAVVLAVFVWPAVGSEAGGLKVQAGEGIGIH